MRTMDNIWPSVQLLLLLAVANGAPILAKRICGARWAAPLDGGLLSKTVRGLVIACMSTAVVAVLFGQPWGIGAVLGALSMLGDALSSFIKRRMGIASSDRATGVDQIPEALLPLLVLRETLGLPWGGVVTITLVFFLLEVPLARLFFWLGVRDRPY
jgi:hypothetical protein